MADNVTSTTTFNGAYRKEVTLTNESDGTGESGVIKINISDYTNEIGATATYMTIDYIEYSVAAFNYVTLAFDHTDDDELVQLSGNGYCDWTKTGGFTDPRSSGGTGDLLLTTDGPVDGASYTIKIGFRPKA